MKAIFHWLSKMSNRNKSASEAINATRPFQSNGSFFRFPIGISKSSTTTVFRHDQKNHLRVFRFVSLFLCEQTEHAVGVPHHGHGGYQRG